MSTNLVFDEEVCLMKMHTKSSKEIYHTKLADTDVHTIKDSSAYAANLILSEKNYELGQKIFQKVVSLQDSNPDSETYGLWPYYMEEPLEEMDAPDFNMAGFNAKEMIVTILKAGECLNDATKAVMYKGIERACRSIIKRNVSVGYTNVCIADSFITVAAGEMLGLEELIEYGKKKLKGLYFYTKTHGDILEYNSPCYSPLAINDVSDFLEYVKDEETLDYAKKVNKIFWSMMAQHFDYETLQLNGPQERAYSDFLAIWVLRIFGRGTGVDYTKHPKFKQYYSEEEKEEYLRETRANPKCPEELIPYFKGEKKFTMVQGLVSDGFNYPYFEYARVATTYKSDNYAIGTMNRSEFWNQRRPILGYIYRKDKDTCFRVKCLHDGYDFSSGAFHCVQYKSDILASINLSEKRGDTHINLDMLKDTIVSAEDLRIVFEFSGNIENITYDDENDGVVFDIDGKKLRIVPFICEFGDVKIKKNIEIINDKIQYSLVWYQGERKDIDISAFEKAMAAFTIEFMPDNEYVQPLYKENGDHIDILWKQNEKELGLKAPKRTLTYERNMYEDKQTIDGVDIVKTAADKL